MKAVSVASAVILSACMVLCCCPATAQDKPSLKVIAWRGDGTGLFPDATPVTEWTRRPLSPNWGLRYSTTRPAKGDDGSKAIPVRSGQILEWLVAGPLASKDPAKVLDEEVLPDEAEIQPTDGDKAGDAQWKKFVSVNKDPGVAMDWILLANIVGREPGKVAYAHNYLYSQAKGTVVFHLDQSGACKIWVNGKVVHANSKPVVTMNSINYVCYAAETHWAGELPVLGDSGSQKIKVELEKGWNRVLIKSTGNLNLRLVETPDARYETKNILWATPLPSYSNAQPIIVGDRIFVMSESEDLICLDKATGKVLWKQGTYYADCLSAEEKQSNPLLKQASELTDKLRATTDVTERIKLRNEIKKAYDAADKKAAAEDPAYAEVRPLQAKLKDKDLTDEQRAGILGKLRELFVKMPGPKEDNPVFAVVEPLEKVAKDPKTKETDRDAILKKIDDVLAKAAPRPRFEFPFHSHIQATGFTNPTPCSDGRFVYIYTGWGVAACYDLEGNRKWAGLLTDLGGHGAFNNNAPVLVDGKFVVLRNVQVRAFEAATGKIAWTTPDLRPTVGVDIWHGFGTGGNPSYSLCSFRAGARNIVYAGGAMIDAADGKVISALVEPYPSNPRGTPVPLGDSLYYAALGSVYRFAIPPTLSGGMRLPRTAHDGGEAEGDTYSSVLVHDGLLYSLRGRGWLMAYDAKTLAPVYKQKLDMEPYEDYDHPGVTPSLVLGGKHIFAFDNQGNCVVIEPGRQFKQVARNTIGTCVNRKWVLDPNEIFQSAPIFEGGRMYLRGETALYCIGLK
ncbi:MAG: PQQ-binding-like beta-propeller repeat protein [Phycisphaerae bacterium]